MDVQLQRLVWTRASGICEYCHIAESFDDLPFCIDHIIAQKHHGLTIAANLALSCYQCNSYKGPNIAGLDPETRRMSRLFNPRTDDWHEHFEWDGAELRGRTEIGRATLDVLAINAADRVEHRRLLITYGVFPPYAAPQQRSSTQQ